MKKLKMKKQILFFLILLVLILFIVPFFLIVINTFKTTGEFIKTPFSLPKSINFENYIIAIKKMDFIIALKNTILITVTATLFNTLFASMTGYFFARKKWKINKIIFMLFLASMVAPFQVYMIPLVKIYGGMFKLANNWLMVSYIAIGLNIPFAVFLYTGFISGIPEELDEAAKIDGCSLIRTYFSVIFPLLKPIMITVMVFVALGVWNDYLMTSLFMTKTDTKTLAIAAFTFLTNHTADYSPMMAGLILGIIPVLIFYFIGQKYIIEGVVTGSVKG